MRGRNLPPKISLNATAQIKNDSPDNAARNNHAYLLCRGIKSILRCDEAEVVSGIARYVVAQRSGLRLLSALIERTSRTPFPTAVALYGGLKSFLAVRQGHQREGAVWIARLGNERQAIQATIDKSGTQFPDAGWTELRFHWRPDLPALLALARNFVVSLGRVPRITRLLRGRYEFFKVLRVVELIAYYSRYLSIFQNARFSLAVTSNHSNPHGIAFNLAARKCGVPVVLITHGMPIRPVAKLFYDLAVVHCEAARQTYVEEGCRMARVLVHSRRSQHRPMPDGPLPERLTVGVFLCKDVNEERLRGLLERLLDHPRVSRILVRPHPTNLWEGLDAWIAERNDPRVSRSFDGPVSRDLDESDIVLAGNSSVLIEAVNAGRPGGYVAGLDYGSTDLHAFVAKGLIYPIDDEHGFDPETMLRFYQRPEWSTTLRCFANIDEDETVVAAQVGTAMRELVALRH
jgi:hypothetical protein